MRDTRRMHTYIHMEAHRWSSIPFSGRPADFQENLLGYQYPFSERGERELCQRG